MDEEQPVPDRGGIEGSTRPLPAINTTVAHHARVWDHWLGGWDNFAVDRQVGDRVRGRFPVLGDVAEAGRRFQTRAVRYLAGEAGIRQFLDLGTGLPTAQPVHEVAQAIAPGSRVVYVDNDPLVLVHARALLTSGPAGATDYLDADVREPAAVLAGAARTLDLSRPVAVLMLGVLDHVHADADARRIVRELLAGVPSGSYLALSHPTLELGGESYGPAVAFWTGRAGPRVRPRTRAQVAALLTGLDLVEPGLAPGPQWRPNDDSEPNPAPGPHRRPNDDGKPGPPPGPRRRPEGDGEPAAAPLWAVVARKP